MELNLERPAKYSDLTYDYFCWLKGRKTNGLPEGHKYTNKKDKEIEVRDIIDFKQFFVKTPDKWCAVNSKRTLNSHSAIDRLFCKKLSQTHLEYHLDRRETFGYTSRRASQIQLLMIDVDAKHGEEDAWEVAWFIINNYFPGAYWDRSTGGNGAHIYLLVDYGKRMGRTAINDKILNEVDVCNALRLIVANQGYKAHVCSIRGTCCHRSDGEIITMGLNAKLPRPTVDTIDWLLASPIFHDTDLNKVIHDATGLEMPINFDNMGDAIFSNNEQRSQDVYTKIIQGIAPNVTSEPAKTSSKVEALLDSHNALDRSRGAAIQYRNIYGVFPSENELNAYYDSLGIGSGPATKARYERNARALEFVISTFDESKTSKRHQYKPYQYLDSLRQRISQDAIETACTEANYDRLLTYEDLDIVLGCHVEESLKEKKASKQFTVPRKGVFNRWLTLKKAGLVERSPDVAKIIAARRALAKAGFIVLLDDEYSFGRGFGTAKKWGLGPMCPEYSTIKKKQNEFLANQQYRESRKVRMYGE